MSTIRLHIPVTPVTKPRMTRRDVWKKRPAVVKYHQFKDDLREQSIPPIPAQFTIIFNVPMPKSWSEKKRKEQFGRPHQQKPDIDNFLKAFLDALCEDDSYVYDVRAIKKWAIFGSIELLIEDEYN